MPLIVILLPVYLVLSVVPFHFRVFWRLRTFQDDDYQARQGVADIRLLGV